MGGLAQDGRLPQNCHFFGSHLRRIMALFEPWKLAQYLTISSSCAGVN
jgi:hypothetical protein